MRTIGTPWLEATGVRNADERPKKGHFSLMLFFTGWGCSCSSLQLLHALSGHPSWWAQAGYPGEEPDEYPRHSDIFWVNKAYIQCGQTLIYESMFSVKDGVKLQGKHMGKETNEEQKRLTDRGGDSAGGGVRVDGGSQIKWPVTLEGGALAEMSHWGNLESVASLSLLNVPMSTSW